MMTPNQLERATQAYRRGYRDAIDGKPAISGCVTGTFGYRDYHDGHEAGRVDLNLCKMRIEK